MSTSSTTARVKDFLNQDATTKWRRSTTGTDAGDEAEAVSRDEIGRIVRDGVTEALEEHERTYHRDEAESESDITEGSQSSGRRVSRGKLLLVGAVAAYLVRRRRGGSDSQSSE